MGNWNWRKRRKYSNDSLPPSESCRELVLNWDDSAAKEAFFSARGRIRTETNISLPQDSCLLDPDIFIDKIDWDSHIDPEVIFDLEKVRVDPDDVGRAERKDPAPVRAASGDDNPWECEFTEDSGGGRDDMAGGGWGSWDRSAGLFPPVHLDTSPSCGPHRGDSTTVGSRWPERCYGRKPHGQPVLQDHRAFRGGGQEHQMGRSGGSFGRPNHHTNPWERPEFYGFKAAGRGGFCSHW